MPQILLTRPKLLSETFANDIAKAGWRSTIWPLMTIRSLLSEPIVVDDDCALIFTSARAIETLPKPAPTYLSAFCVGPATAITARRYGFQNVTDISGDGDRLVEVLSVARPLRYLHVRGAHTTGNIAERLTFAGRPTGEVVAYEAIAATSAPEAVHTAINGGNIDALALFSPRTAAIFTSLARPEWTERLNRMIVYAISPAAAEPVKSLGFSDVVIADRPNGEAMRAAICGAATE